MLPLTLEMVRRKFPKRQTTWRRLLWLVNRNSYKYLVDRNLRPTALVFLIDPSSSIRSLSLTLFITVKIVTLLMCFTSFCPSSPYLVKWTLWTTFQRKSSVKSHSSGIQFCLPTPEGSSHLSEKGHTFWSNQTNRLVSVNIRCNPLTHFSTQLRSYIRRI